MKYFGIGVRIEALKPYFDTPMQVYQKLIISKTQV